MPPRSPALARSLTLACGLALLAPAALARPEPTPAQARLCAITDWTTPDARESRRHLVLIRGTVRGALASDLAAAGLPAPLAEELVRLLAHAVDFQRDLHPGEGFAVLFERFRDEDGAPLGEGAILHAGFTLGRGSLAFWRQATEAGADWFDDGGRSLRRLYLRTPLDSTGVTSAFGLRDHPVLGFTRMHQGVDFAAPIGTPVHAAADGEVAEIGFAGGYGRRIILRHPDGAETLYGHLSAFGLGLKPGDRVRQGSVIGLVGASGVVTGPHLHYELTVAGRKQNPAHARIAPASQLEGEALDSFRATRQLLLAALEGLEPRQELASAE